MTDSEDTSMVIDEVLCPHVLKVRSIQKELSCILSQFGSLEIKLMDLVERIQEDFYREIELKTHPIDIIDRLCLRDTSSELQSKILSIAHFINILTTQNAESPSDNIGRSEKELEQLFSGECFKTKQTIIDDKNIKTENQKGNISIKKKDKVDKKNNNLINPNQQHRYEEEKEEVGEGEVTEKINQMKETEFSVNLSQTYLESEILDKRFKNEKSIHISSIFMIKEKKKQSKTKDSQKVSNEKEKRKEEEEIVSHPRNSVPNITNNNNDDDEDVDFLSKLKTKYNFSDNFTSIKEANHKTDQPQPTSQMMHSSSHFSETPTQMPLFPPQPPPLPVPVPTKLMNSTQPPPPPPLSPQQFPVHTTYDTPPPSPLPTSNYSTPLTHDLPPHPPVSVGSFSDMMSSISSPSTPSPITSTTTHSSVGKTRRFRPPKIPT